MTVLYFGQGEATKDLFREQLLDNPPPAIAIDVECISREEHVPLGFAVATSPVDSWYFQVLPEHDPEIELIQPLLSNPNIIKVMQHAPFDIEQFGMIASLNVDKLADTIVMARLLGHIEADLATLSRDILSIELETTNTLLKPKQKFTSLPVATVGAMCCSHARATLALYYEFEDKIDKDYFAVEMRAIPILVAMSLRGLKINQEDRAALEVKLSAEVEYYHGLCEDEDFNPGSPMQVGYILAKRGNFLPFTRSKKQYKTDSETLEFLDDPLASVVLDYRKASKLLSTYIKPLANHDRLYTQYNLDAVVGRISSGGANDSTDMVMYRNLQNIPPPDKTRSLLPEGTRYIFEPDSGIFTTGDFSQEHLRILAYLSQDREMLRVYQEGEFEGDIHLKSAKELGIDRKLAKVINYAIPYGADAKTVSVQARIRDIRKCSSFLDKWFKTYRDAADWIRGAKEEGLRDGWSLPTLYGRRIRIPEEFKWNGQPDLEGMGRKAVNYPILGSDGEIMKRALIVCEDCGLPLAVTVHDSITCDGDIEFPTDTLENLSPVHIPFEVKRTFRWE